MHLFPLKPEALFKIFWTHVCINHKCRVVLACFRNASSKASFLGVQPCKCQKYTEKTRKPPLTLTHAWASLPSLPGIESIAPSYAPTTAPRLLSTAAKTPPGVCFRSSLPAVSSGNSCRVRCKSPSFIGLFVELLLHFLLPLSVLNSKEDIAFSFEPSHVLPLCAPR